MPFHSSSKKFWGVWCVCWNLRGNLGWVNLGWAAVQLCVIFRKTGILLTLQSTAEGFWVPCFTHHNVLKNYQYSFDLAFSNLKPFCCSEAVDLWAKTIPGSRCGLQGGAWKGLLADSLHWEGLIIETNWGRKRTGSIRASSAVSFKLEVGLER